MTTLTTRRAMMRGPVSEQPDGDLLALGKQFEKMAEELTTVRQWVDEVGELCDAEVERFATWPDDQEKWSVCDAKAYCKTRKHVECETEIGAAFNRAFEYQEACYQKLDPLYRQIRSFAAQTPQGHTLQMRVLATILGDRIDELWG
jgi:hypothetical protein